MKLIFFLFSFIFYIGLSFGQCLVDSSKGFVIGTIKVQFDGRKKIKKKSDKIQVVFREGFNDSLITCYNGIVVNNSFVLSDNDSLLGLSNTFFNVNIKKQKNNKLLFIIPQKKFIIEIKIVKGYKYLDVYHYNNFWTINYRNSIIVYQ